MFSSFIKQFSLVERLSLAIILLIYVHNLFLDIMIVDAAQYAGMSSEMAHTFSFLQVKEFQQDYLDKPPLLFWLSSSSILVLGISNFAYKFPSFLFLLFSLYAIYRFCLLYYSGQIARYALIILASCQAYFLMTNDVRTDAMLCASVIGAIWLLSEYLERQRLQFLILGALLVGTGMLVKGPIAFIAIMFPLGVHLMYLGRWKSIFNWHWLILLLIVGVLLLPMCYGLYQQFDLHPEKITYGKLGQKGLYFYFWLQSFGRITGENVWNNGLPWHFFLGSSLWDYFPWIIPLYFGLFSLIKKWIWEKARPIEIISIVGFLSLFAMLSLSKYKLPHYIFVTLPFASVITAKYLGSIGEQTFKNWSKFYLILGIIILSLLIIYPLFLFNELSVLTFVCIGIQVGVLYYFFKVKETSIVTLLGPVLVLNLFLSFVFYPNLLTYQADSMAGKWILENRGNVEVSIYKTPSHAFNFYSKNPFTKVIQPTDWDKISTPCWVYVEGNELKEVQNQSYKIVQIKEFQSFAITQLKLPFLLKSTRNQQLEKKYLIKLDK